MLEWLILALKEYKYCEYQGRAEVKNTWIYTSTSPYAFME
jgi:hypothetical protein